MSVSSRIFSLMAALTVFIVGGVVACGDIDVATIDSAATTTTVPATTTTTVDPAAVRLLFETIVAQQQAEQAQLEAEAAQARQQRQQRTTSSAPSGARNASTGGLIPAQNACAIPARICTRESNNTLNARNASGAAGKYQFMPGTWNGYGGYASADQAPEDVQDAKARELWNGGAGCSHWSAC